MDVENVEGWESVPFRLVDKRSGEVLLAAEDILGYFLTPDQVPPPTVTFARVHRIVPGRKKTEEAELQVVDRRGERIGAYYLGRVKAVHGDMPEVSGGRKPDVAYDFFGFAEEYPRAGEIWKKWSDGGPAEPGEWARIPADSHESWLHVVQTSWFTTDKRATRYDTDETVFLDGSAIAGRDSLYCALGEAFNGPRGYFGSNLDALFDCLRTSRAEGVAPSTLVWRDYPSSREALGAEFTDRVLALLTESGMTVVAEQAS